MITTKRSPNGRHRLVLDGKIIGEAWKLQGKPGFGLSLEGFYWVGRQANRQGGLVVLQVCRLKDAVAEASAIYNVK